jgi:SepF-like predicted cell division protein (DUF552 family)
MKKPKTTKVKSSKKSLKKLEEAEVVLGETRPLVSSEDERYSTYRYLYKSTKVMVKKLRVQAEDGEKINTREIYALCTLITQLREVMNDMRQLDDASQNVKQLAENVVQPFTSNIGQKLLDSFYAIQKSILEYAPPKASAKIIEELKLTVKSQAAYIEEQNKIALSKIETLFRADK